MAASLTEQILARALAVLTGTTAAGTNVQRGRADAIAADALPALTLRRVGTVHDAASLNADKIATAFTLVVDVSAADQAAAETAADALHLDAHAQLMADATLGTLGRYTLRCTGTDSEGEGADEDYYRITAHYEIDAWVRQGDITQPA